LGGDVLLRSRGRRSGREARADGLLDPDHIGEAVPGIGVRDGLVGAVLPEEGAIFLEEALERGAAGLGTVRTGVVELEGIHLHLR
jgi:hypothetical protein